jgi:hypothetical protein
MEFQKRRNTHIFNLAIVAIRLRNNGRVQATTFLHDAGKACLDKARDKILWNAGVVFSNQGTSLIAAFMPSHSMAVAEKIIELFLDGNKQVIVQQDFLGNLIVVDNCAQGIAMSFA